MSQYSKGASARNSRGRNSLLFKAAARCSAEIPFRPDNNAPCRSISSKKTAVQPRLECLQPMTASTGRKYFSCIAVRIRYLNWASEIPGRRIHCRKRGIVIPSRGASASQRICKASSCFINAPLSISKARLVPRLPLPADRLRNLCATLNSKNMEKSTSRSFSFSTGKGWALPAATNA